MRAMSPTVQQPAGPVAGPVGSPAEMSALFREIRQDAKAERDELEAKMKTEHKAEMATIRAEVEKIRAELAPQELISAEQLAALQARLESLHSAQLLADEEFFALEDLCADYIEMQTAAGGVLTQEIVYSSPASAAARLAKLVGVSEGIASDAGFARQARRKFPP